MNVCEIKELNTVHKSMKNSFADMLCINTKKLIMDSEIRQK